MREFRCFNKDGPTKYFMFYIQTRKRGVNVSLKQWELSEKHRPENKKNPMQNAVVITLTEKQK